MFVKYVIVAVCIILQNKAEWLSMLIVFSSKVSIILKLKRKLW